MTTRGSAISFSIREEMNGESVQLPVSRSDAEEPQQGQQGKWGQKTEQGDFMGTSRRWDGFSVTRSIIRGDFHILVPQRNPNICKVRLHLSLLVTPEQLSHPDGCKTVQLTDLGVVEKCKNVTFRLKFLVLALPPPKKKVIYIYVFHDSFCLK